MSDGLNAAVVLAALEDMLEPMTTHRATHLSIMRCRVERLRDQVAQYVQRDASRAYQSGEWCGECVFGVVEDPPCCTRPEPHVSGREDER